MLRMIVSGGQTGADQAALDFAIEYTIPHGGWVPKGRRTEDGSLNEKYNVLEMPTESYPKRTEQNVLDSDGTLIISHGKLSGGSELTSKLARKHCRPWLHVDLQKKSIVYSARMVKQWLIANGIGKLNVAGPRSSSDPRISKAVRDLLEKSIV